MEAALRTFGTEEAALDYLVSQPNPNVANATHDANAPNAAAAAASLGQVGGSNGEGSVAADHAGGSSSRNKPVEERDLEMEGELTGELGNADAYSDYDLEVTKEGEAIDEYLALLTSAENAA